MSTIKTPEQIAGEIADATRFRPITNADVAGVALRAIEADRAQRTIVSLVADVIDARHAQHKSPAADLVRNTDPDDDLWNNYIIPMVESIEQDYTAAAAANAEGE